MGRLAYDGRGNAVVKSLAELEEAMEALGGQEQGLYGEKWVNFTKVVCNSDGNFSDSYNFDIGFNQNRCQVNMLAAIDASLCSHCLEKYQSFGETMKWVRSRIVSEAPKTVSSRGCFSTTQGYHGQAVWRSSKVSVQ